MTFKSERIKTIHDEYFGFDNIDNPLSFLLQFTFCSLRPRSHFQTDGNASRLFLHKKIRANKYNESFGVDISKDVFDCIAVFNDIYNLKMI